MIHLNFFVCLQVHNAIWKEVIIYIYGGNLIIIL